jgi:hypothetical protein
MNETWDHFGIGAIKDESVAKMGYMKGNVKAELSLLRKKAEM